MRRITGDRPESNGTPEEGIYLLAVDREELTAIWALARNPTPALMENRTRAATIEDLVGDAAAILDAIDNG